MRADPRLSLTIRRFFSSPPAPAGCSPSPWKRRESRTEWPWTPRSTTPVLQMASPRVAAQTAAVLPLAGQDLGLILHLTCRCEGSHRDGEPPKDLQASPGSKFGKRTWSELSLSRAKARLATAGRLRCNVEPNRWQKLVLWHDACGRPWSLLYWVEAGLGTTLCWD